MLQQERDRADHDGDSVSLVIFDLGRSGREGRQEQVLARFVAERIGTADVIGWLDRRHLGIVLPHRTLDNASALVDHVCGHMASAGMPTLGAAYSYPSDWFYERSGAGPDSCTAPPSSRPSNGRRAVCRPTAGVARRERGRGCTPVQGSRPEPLPRRAHQSWCGHLVLCPVPRWKRWLDIVGAVGLLILSLPLLVLVAAVIRVGSPGPIIFRQVRRGFLGRPFTIWKFRTMRANVDPGAHQDHVTNLVRTEGCLDKLDGHCQLIPGGAWIRKLGIDELPQLMNVIRGEMSLVGPRPDVVPIEAYHPWHLRRFEAAPGITGLWQVSGKNRTTLKEMVKFDILYVRHKSLWLDLKILARTIPAVIMQLREAKSA